LLLVFIIIKRQQELKEFCFEGQGFHPRHFGLPPMQGNDRTIDSGVAVRDDRQFPLLLSICTFILNSDKLVLAKSCKRYVKIGLRSMIAHAVFH
jgi:hypothetical protein